MATDDSTDAVKADYDSDSNLGRVYEKITGDEDARVCKDIPEAACRHLPRNYFAYLGANLLGKISDELASARLILPWLLSTLGAPAAFTGFLVPIREAGVLLPQLLVAACIRRMPIRKPVWLAGAVLSALAMAIMAVAAYRISGVSAGWTIVALLIVYSLARGLCSVSAKDVLGKTVSKKRRGSLMGYSAGIAGGVTLLLGLYLQTGQPIRSETLLVALLVAAAVLWLLAAISFATIREEPGATEGGGNALTVAAKSFRLLLTDLEFREYVIVRIMLLSVALVLPFYVLLAQQHAGSSVGGLGMMIIASGLAGSLSAPVWGRLGDRSSRKVMIRASWASGMIGILTWLMVSIEAGLMHHMLTYAVLFLSVSVCHSGVRLGRKVYLVDMSTTENRSLYVAVSNTIIGIAMLIGGLFGLLADLIDVSSVILLLGLLACGAGVYALRLSEVSG